MTRTLSTILQADQMRLRQQLHQLERVSGHQNHDIKLSVDVMHIAQHKVHALGLDKHDTTGKELYHVLLQRVTDDDKRLERTLRTRAATHISAEANVADGIVHALEAEIAGQRGMSLKVAVAKRLLKKTPAKRLMKSLGYRSFDSMVRQESPALLIAAAAHIETIAWRKSWLDGYKQLKPSDFEDRSMVILHPNSERWREVSEKMVIDKSETILAVPEMGAIILLPLPKERPNGMIIATMAMALHELNGLSAAANYIRAAEVHADFGGRIKAVASGNVFLEPAHMPQALPWHLLQRYFATTQAVINEDIFGPYVQASDFVWKNVEDALTRISPSLAFWQGTNYVTSSHDGQAVSFNLLDGAINSCNKIAYEARTAYHAQQALWHELCLRYVNHESIEQAVASLLQPQLAYSPAVNK